MQDTKAWGGGVVGGGVVVVMGVKGDGVRRLRFAGAAFVCAYLEGIVHDQRVCTHVVTKV